MSELKGLSSDPMKNAADIARYNVEFQDLQTLLFILSGYEFNGHRLFDLNGTQSFASGGITIDVNTTGAHHGVETVQITQLPYLAGLTFSVNAAGDVQTTSGSWSDVNTGGDGGSVVPGIYTLAVNSGLNLNLNAVHTNLLTKALVNIASMRAGNADNYNAIISSITNQPPQFQSDGNLSIAENTTFVFEFNATDPDGDVLTYSIPYGDDHALFEINATTGALSFISPKDYEAPEDNNTDNIYELTIDISDGNASASLNVNLTIQDIDDTAPVITLIGDSNITHEAGAVYTDAGAQWNDSVDGNGTADANGTVDHNNPSTYIITYSFTDSSGNAADESNRTIHVVDTTPPVITIIGDANATHLASTTFIDQGANWTDAVDGNGTADSNGTVDHTTPGTYQIIYSFTDSNGNQAQSVIRTVNVVDSASPVITLLGDSNITHEAGAVYTDAGAQWNDSVDGNGTADANGTVDHNNPGTYIITYSFTDSSGNAADESNRTIHVVDTTPPVITIIGDANATHLASTTFIDQGANWTDAVDGNGTADSNGTVDHTTPGTYQIIYSFTDSNGNQAQSVIRTVNVVDSASPVITLLGDSNITHEAGAVYTDAGAQWNDSVDGNGTADANGTVDHNNPGTYIITYSFTDSSGNAADESNRTIHVVDTTPPVITIIGDANATHLASTTFIDQGANWTDAVDGNGTADSNGTVDHTTPGTYQIIYSFTDSNGNQAQSVIRTVNVVDSASPVITLLGDSNITHEAGAVYTDAGAQWNDSVDGNGTADANGTVDHNNPGTYIITYSFTDSSGNAADESNRTIHVVDTTPPVITIIGDANATHLASTTFIDQGANWTDAVDGNGTADSNGTVDHTTPGTYQIIYSFTDSNGNQAQSVIRTVNVVDSASPVITLLGDSNITHEAGAVYTDAGAQWNDSVDGNGTADANGTVDHNNPGTYIITYSFTDSSGNAADESNRTIHVVDTTPPVITIIGDANATHLASTTFIDQGANWTDAVDGNGTADSNGTVDHTTPGTYQIIYSFTDSNGNQAQSVIRTVNVVDSASPVITLLGDSNITHEAGAVYTDAGAQWNDSVDGNGTADANGTVDHNNPGTYIITYSFTDSSGNAADESNRTIHVVDTTPPVITIIGDANATHLASTTFIDQGANWTDAVDGNGTADSNGTVDHNTPGTYQIIYSVTDSSGNQAQQVTRTVNVVDSAFPVITLIGDANITHEAGTVYTDAGAQWNDSVDGNGTADANGTVDHNNPGTYIITYSFTDSSGNLANDINRTIHVVDTTPPVITLIGDANVTHLASSTYVDPGANWTDLVDGNGTADSNGTVDHTTPGTYQIIYSFTDSNGNQAQSVIRTINVENLTSNQNPVFQSDGNIDLVENNTFVYNFDATDPNGDILSYSIEYGIDAYLFELNSTTGELFFLLPKDYENPEDNNSDNIYELSITVSNGDQVMPLNLHIQITDEQFEPDFDIFAPLQIEENRPIGSFVGQFDAINIEPHESFTYSVLSFDDNPMAIEDRILELEALSQDPLKSQVDIDAYQAEIIDLQERKDLVKSTGLFYVDQNGSLRTNQMLDFEAFNFHPYLPIMVQAVNEHNYSITKHFVVEVMDREFEPEIPLPAILRTLDPTEHNESGFTLQAKILADGGSYIYEAGFMVSKSIRFYDSVRVAALIDQYPAIFQLTS